MAGCRVKFFFVSNCEAFEIIGTSGPARINGILNNFLGPQPGRVYSLQLQQGELIEITPIGTSLNDARALIASVGRATGGDANHLVDSGRNWPPGFFQYNSPGFKLRPNLVILSGSGAGKSTSIIDNDATSLTFTPVGGLVPDSSTEYAIVWNYSDGVGLSAKIEPLIFTVPETGAYTVEVATPLGGPGVNPYGRAIYVLQKGEIGNTNCMLAWPLSAAYDSTRDCFWVIDNPSSDFSPTASYLNKISTGGVLISRTAIAPAGYGVLVYCPVNDRLALVAQDTGDLVIVDPQTVTIESTTALGISNSGTNFLGAFCPVNNLVYLPGGAVIDPVAKTLVATVALPALFFLWVPTFIAADNNIWYSRAFGYGAYDVQVVDPMTNLVAHTIPIATNTLGGQLAYSAATGLVYGSGTGYPATLSVLDPVGYTLLRQRALDHPTNVNGMVVGNDGFLYAGTEAYAEELSSLVKIDLATETIVTRMLAPPQNMLLYLSSGGDIGMLSFGDSSLGSRNWNGDKSFATFTP